MAPGRSGTWAGVFASWMARRRVGGHLQQSSGMGNRRQQWAQAPASLRQASGLRRMASAPIGGRDGAMWPANSLSAARRSFFIRFRARNDSAADQLVSARGNVKRPTAIYRPALPAMSGDISKYLVLGAPSATSPRGEGLPISVAVGPSSIRNFAKTAFGLREIRRALSGNSVRS